MKKVIHANNTETEQDNLQDLTFDELLARSPGGRKDQFSMRIEVQSKTVKEFVDFDGQPYIEIVVDYVTVPKGKQKTKRTRPFFPDGELICKKISDEPGVHYLVTLTRVKDPNKPFYDWTEIVRLDESSTKPALIETLTAETEGESDAANESTFEQSEGEGSDPLPIAVPIS